MSEARINNNLRHAYHLWMRYKTQTSEYASIAASLGVSRLQLNAKCHELHQAKRHEKLKRRSNKELVQAAIKVLELGGKL